ncbi:MAG: purine-nucleoside phosphorylase [Clostridiaceae bacterium]|nr:purine-nucleoside phosphorylase [Clostridiaceae bacterium]
MIDSAVKYIRSKIPASPEVAIILGSGLGGLADKIENPVYIDYGELEDFPVSTAPGHKGRFVYGELNGKRVICMQGRFHYYEGYTMKQIIAPVRVMRKLGAEYLIVTNAAGGVNKSFNVGDIMLITDHINFMGTNPLIGKNDDEFGVRFPDMSFAYNPDLRRLAAQCSASTGVEIKEGVYLGCTGPSYETPAEIRAFRTLGADAVGMSTVPEIIAASHLKFKTLAFSLITNMAAGILDQPLTEEEVLETGARKGAEMQKLICEIIGRI